MVEISRRRFLTIVSGAAAGIWLSETGLIAAPRKMVLALAGTCSFCGKSAHEVWGLAGRPARDVRICNECSNQFIRICLETPPPPLLPPPPKGTSPELDALLAEMENYRIKRERAVRKRPMLNCSFCDALQLDVKKLIGGPRVYICDGCIADAASIIGGIRRRPA